MKRARCTRCGDLQPVPSRFWKNDVADALESARVAGARGGGVELGGPTIECRGLPPLCRKCFTLIDLGALSKVWHEATGETHAQIYCGRCGEPHSARCPPEWAKELIEDAVFVFGEVTGEPGPEGPRDLQVPVVSRVPRDRRRKADRTLQVLRVGRLLAGRSLAPLQPGREACVLVDPVPAKAALTQRTDGIASAAENCAEPT